MYSWDAENRLTRVMNVAGLSSSFRRVEWKYDALGRRTRQTTYILTNGVWQVVEDLKLISGPVLFGRHVAELNGTNKALVRPYVWGLDLSETLDGAGGVGGLLWVRMNTGPASGAHFVCYDGNGNVWNLVSATSGTESARYEYGPFGEPLRLSGPAALSNPFRFSTKRSEDLSGLVLYEYRAYSPSLGRWLSRDPIDERTLGLMEPMWPRDATGGSVSGAGCTEMGCLLDELTVYTFVRNRTRQMVDQLGLRDCPAWAEWMCEHPPGDQTGAFMAACGSVVALLAPWPGEEAIAGIRVAAFLRRWARECREIRCRVRLHEAHHRFPVVGRRCHVHVNCWIRGVKGSGLPAIRIAIPCPPHLRPYGE
ncbi:MAG: hypothetical protein KatS3mg132_638 [Limisphaera sp.]|nr:MAG: hypothetical protein KatS3mg132_638 [Limisphaera sp.]